MNPATNEGSVRAARLDFVPWSFKRSAQRADEPVRRMTIALATRHLLAAVLTLLSCACVIGDHPNQHIAMTVDSQGKPVIVGTWCGIPGPVIVSVSNIPDGSSAPGGRTFWQIASNEVLVPVDVVVGRTPEGFRESIHLDEPLDTYSTYVAQIDYPGAPSSEVMSFSISGLPSDGVLIADNKVVSEDAFVSEGLKASCGASLPPT